MPEIVLESWNKNDSVEQVRAKDKWLGPDRYPRVMTLGAGHLYRFIPIPHKPAEKEFVYVDLNGKDPNVAVGTLAPWNVCWEMGQFRADVLEKHLPEDLRWLEKTGDRNIYLLPRYGTNNFEALSILYHLLPLETLKRFNLPVISSGSWPAKGFLMGEADKFPADIEERLSRAFAYHIWPLLNSQSRPSAFTEDEPLRLLAHNLNFWLPHAYQVAEDRLKDVPPMKLEGKKDKNKLAYYQATNPKDLVRVDRPRYAADVWEGEDEAWEATEQLFETADGGGRLRALIDAVKSGRCEDDFSDEWSFAREDFERKLYSKRSKVKVAFVEFDDTIPVHGPEAEIHDRLLWENFIALLNPKEKQIVICLRNGATNLTEVAEEMGYANHSPVSKALAEIRRKAEKLLL